MSLKIIARFINGLHKEILDAVELQTYVSLEDVIKLAMKIERQRRRRTTKVNKPFSSSSTSIYPFEGVPKPEFKKETTNPVMVDKGKATFESSQSSRSLDIKCFTCLGHGHIASQCPNRKVMIVKDAVEEIVSDDESDPRVEEEEELVVHQEE